jgi:hypothetical protein
MTLFHTTHHPVAGAAAKSRAQVKAPAWIGRVAWARIAALGINIAFWALIILGVRALTRL